MFVLLFVTFIDLFVSLFSALIFLRVLLSYFMRPENRFYGWIVSVTEPILWPVRKVLPASPMLDLAPLVTWFLLQGLQILVHQIL